MSVSQKDRIFLRIPQKELELAQLHILDLRVEAGRATEVLGPFRRGGGVVTAGHTQDSNYPVTEPGKQTGKWGQGDRKEKMTLF